MRYKVIIFLAALVSLSLAVSAFSAARLAKENNADGSPVSFFAFAKPVVPRFTEIDLLAKQLKFMVWEAERRKLAYELSKRLRIQINITPFDAYLWRRLSYAERAAGHAIEQRIWTLERALMLAGWNDKERLILSHHCFLDYAQFGAYSSEFCSDILHDLPSIKSLTQLAHMVGVDSKRIQEVLAQEGLDLSGSQ